MKRKGRKGGEGEGGGKLLSRKLDTFRECSNDAEIYKRVRLI